MDNSGLAQVCAAILGGSALPSLLRAARRAFVGGAVADADKASAEARKLNAEADDSIYSRLYREIHRLDTEMTDMRAELADSKQAASDERHMLEKENVRLRSEVARLRRRIEQLETLLKTVPLTDEMNVLLHKIDSATSKPAPPTSDSTQ